MFSEGISVANDAAHVLEFDRVLELLARECQFSLAAERAHQIGPSGERLQVDYLLTITREATALLTDHPGFSVGGVRDVRDIVERASVGSLLARADLRQVLDTVARALAGEQEGIDDLAAEMRGDGVRIGLNGIFVRCHSFPSDPGIAEVIEHIERTGLPPSLGGPEITDDTLRPYLSLSCDGLPNSGGDYVRFSGSPSATILVIGITGDHATPYEGSQQLVRELGNARLLTLEANGHIASFSNRSACADAAASAYLLEGELPPEGTVCAAD